MHRAATSTSASADPALQAIDRVVDACSAAFPNHITSIYLLGSHVDLTHTPQSDVDLSIVWKETGANAKQKERADELMLDASKGVELDVEHISERSLLHGMTPSLKLDSRVLFGRDDRDECPLVQITDWTRDRMHTSYWRMVRLFYRPQVVRMPLQYPYAAGEFFGYDSKYVRDASGTLQRSTRDLVRSVCWSASALVAWKAKQYVASKQQTAAAYRKHVGDEWTPLIEEMINLCRTKWEYLVPAQGPDRQQLRAICERTLAFESHFLANYRAFLITQLRSEEAADSNHARWMMERILFDDPDVVTAIDR